MKIKLLHHTPLWVASQAIRTCYNSFDKSDSTEGVCGEKDKELINRVGNKFKHRSVLEHLVLVFETTYEDVSQEFKQNNFSTVTSYKEDTNNAYLTEVYVISTNLRVLIEINLLLEIKRQIVPDEYKYLIEGAYDGN